MRRSRLSPFTRRNLALQFLSPIYARITACILAYRHSTQRSLLHHSVFPFRVAACAALVWTPDTYCSTILLHHSADAQHRITMQHTCHGDMYPLHCIALVSHSMKVP
eukprot:jgi/Ulvmu1/12463/UM009_0115.1